MSPAILVQKIKFIASVSLSTPRLHLPHFFHNTLYF